MSHPSDVTANVQTTTRGACFGSAFFAAPIMLVNHPPADPEIFFFLAIEGESSCPRDDNTSPSALDERSGRIADVGVEADQLDPESNRTAAHLKAYAADEMLVQELSDFRP